MNVRANGPSTAGSARRQAGFTYIGVMIFLAILAVVSAASLSAGSSLQRRMNEEELLFIGGEFAEAFKSYFEATPAGQRSYPAKLEELLRDPRYPGVRRHLRKIYVDPMTGRAEWGLVVAPNGIVGVHSLSEHKALKVAEFEPAFAVLSGRTHYVDWKFGFASPGVVLPANVVLAGALAPVVKPVAGKPGSVQPGAAPASKFDIAPIPKAPLLSPAPASESPPAR